MMIMKTQKLEDHAFWTVQTEDRLNYFVWWANENFEPFSFA